jgi:hypothetical protein
VITKDQALTADNLHYTGRHDCTIHIGPRGGKRVNITAVRRSGQTQTWKTRPEDFKMPVKFGLYESSYATHENANDWHTLEDCPVREDN